MARENTSMARKAKGRDVEDRGQLSRYNRVQMDSSKLLTWRFDTFSIVSSENRRTSHSLGERVCCYQICHHQPPPVGQPAFSVPPVFKPRMHYLYRVEDVAYDASGSPSAATPWFPSPSFPRRMRPSEQNLREELRERIIGGSTAVDDNWQSDSDEIPEKIGDRRSTPHYTCMTESLMWAFWCSFMHKRVLPPPIKSSDWSLVARTSMLDLYYWRGTRSRLPQNPISRHIQAADRLRSQQSYTDENSKNREISD